MNWFEKLTGFAEESPRQVRENLQLTQDHMISRVNGRSWTYGQLETPSLGELRQRLKKVQLPGGRLTAREIVADAGELHADPGNAGALFQVASQFNLLEMVNPGITPEDGIGRYETDPTQGPACAIAAGAGTIYRNYFVPVEGAIGQSQSLQIDCLADLGTALGNTHGVLWKMRNGYALACESGLREISRRLRGCSPDERDAYRQLLRVGVQWNTQVTLNGCEHLVSQVYCSALPVAYCSMPPMQWEDFACLVLEGAYEATLSAAALNLAKQGNNKVFLTLLGNGAFGNETPWILEALSRALNLFKDVGLDVRMVSFQSSNPPVRQLVSVYPQHEEAA